MRELLFLVRRDARNRRAGSAESEISNLKFQISSSASARSQPAAQGEPPLGRVIDQLEIAAIKLLEPAPPFDGLQLFAQVRIRVAAQADFGWFAGNRCPPQAAAGRPVVDRVVIRRLVNRHYRRF